jgi:hypothetical protein
MEKCIRCGTEFGCGNIEGRGVCWCAELPPVMPVTDEGCLCPPCLKAEITARVGKCLDCAHAKTLKTKTGSAIFLCGRAESEPSYAKYPRLPMAVCAGWVKAEGSAAR